MTKKKKMKPKRFFSFFKKHGFIQKRTNQKKNQV